MEEKREGSRSLSQQEEDALQSIARSDLGGLFKARMDEGFTLLYANDSYYAIHGYTRGQLEQEMHGQAGGLVHRRMWRGSASTCGGPWQKTRGPSPLSTGSSAGTERWCGFSSAPGCPRRTGAWF